MHTRSLRLFPVLCAGALALSTLACSDDAISSDEEARRAYLALDTSIGKSLTLGFEGFNAASSANIPPQTADGDESGTLTITGQVDQGSSDNKGMRLYVGMVDYSDGAVVIDNEEHEIDITYDTDADPTLQPYLVLTLRNIPNGTFEGSLSTGASTDGVYFMTGDLEGDVALDLTMSGNIAGTSAADVHRVSGSTTITGTATSGDGTYEIDLTI